MVAVCVWRQWVELWHCRKGTKGSNQGLFTWGMLLSEMKWIDCRYVPLSGTWNRYELRRLPTDR